MPNSECLHVGLLLRAPRIGLAQVAFCLSLLANVVVYYADDPEGEAEKPVAPVPIPPSEPEKAKATAATDSPKEPTAAAAEETSAAGEKQPGKTPTDPEKAPESIDAGSATIQHYWQKLFIFGIVIVVLGMFFRRKPSERKVMDEKSFV